MSQIITKTFNTSSEQQKYLKEIQFATKGTNFKINTKIRETKDRVIITRYLRFSNRTIKKVEIFDTNK